MKYPVNCKNIIDVTKPPYHVDNTGKVDCTESLCQIFDDILIREVKGVEEIKKKLLRMGKVPAYIGFESRITDELNVIFPEYVPSSKIIYFPAGIYWVSDTISYRLKNLQNIFLSKPFSELCRGIHILGESKDSVVIRLADHARGFEKEAKKPVISFNNAPNCCLEEKTNVAQMNTIEDLTIDCGSGNPGAVGIRFSASNSGRIENVTLRAQEGYCGIHMAYGAEGSFVNIKADGFDYGVDTFVSSLCVFEDMQLAGNRRSAIKLGDGKVLFHRIKSEPLPLFEFYDGPLGKGKGAYYCSDCDSVPTEDAKGNKVYVAEEGVDTTGRLEIPWNPRSKNPLDYVCVDDFGAVGDGLTDSTAAIQAAFDSGKPIILFGEGHYLVDGEITIPATVKTIDFMFCDLFAGKKLKFTRGGALFHINEDSSDLLFMENLYTFEQFHGHFRLIKHGAVRDLCLSDLHTQTAAMYFNTVSGSKVYIDNCACTTGSYSQNIILEKEGEDPEYTYVIPFEFHGQCVYGRQVNPERADVEILNNGSTVYLDGFKVEGPGTAMKTINGGHTVINVFSAGIGNAEASNALIETKDGTTILTGGLIGSFEEETMYHIVYESDKDGKVSKIMSKEVPDHVGPYTLRLGRYQV